MTRLFSGDVKPGSISPFTEAQGTGPRMRAAGIYSLPAWNYPIKAGDWAHQVVCDDADCGYAYRFELRAEDAYPPEGPYYPRQRDQLSLYPANYQSVGDTIWIAWSTKFDEGFETYPEGREGEHLITDEWHTVDISEGFAKGLYGALICWGMPAWTGAGGFPPAGNLGQVAGTPPDMWSLFVDTYTYNAGTDMHSQDARIILLNTPMNRGRWIDVKMRIYFHKTAGTIKVWINNQPQTLLTGGTTWTGQTAAPGFADNDMKYYYAPTIYRGSAVFGTQIREFANLRIADSEASL